MRTFDQVSGLRAYLHAVREDGKKVGFVPTMGALHEGHLALMRRARDDCDVVVVSIFVNPTQFGPGEDYERYPRDLPRDSRLAQQVGVDALFTPSVEEMYPPGGQTVVEVPELAKRWEGEFRPGHFRGVATVCAKLFNIVQPDCAYFGQKDYQQLKVIERLVTDLHLPLTIVPVATVRDPDGLALSSRNSYLSPVERQAATVLHRALEKVEALFNAGERSGRILQEVLLETLAQEPMAVIDYAAVADAETLEPLEKIEHRAVALLAVRIGTTRLIDNTLLGTTHNRHENSSLRA
ncbi:MAG TPA: pantoate--beta-alanine ligase [Chthonomonadales bacterium]|nr:pantoate--beta-alanine ligase [Chthonomonadales bacterium]